MFRILNLDPEPVNPDKDPANNSRTDQIKVHNNGSVMHSNKNLCI